MARIGGVFPFPVANVSEGGTRIDLASGGVFVFPPNQYLVATDANTQVQWWDPQGTNWQTLWGHSNGGDITADGSNYRILNDSGVISTGVIANGTAAGLTNGIGPTQTGVAATISAPASGIQQATAYVIVGGTVAAPTVTQAGSGFLTAPLIVIDPPPIGGIQATAHATMTGGGIATIVIDNPGAGYIGTPNFWIIPQQPVYPGGPPGGQTSGLAAGVYPAPGLVFPSNAVPGNQNIGPLGAQITPVALTGSGLITGFVRINWGGNYSGTPTVTLANSGTGSLGTAAITLSAVSAAAVATVLITPRIAS